MESSPKSKGVSPSKSAPAESTRAGVTSSKSAPTKYKGVSPSKSTKAIYKSASPSKSVTLRRFAAGGESETFKVKLTDESASAPAAQEELANYEQLVARAVDVFGDEIKASKWLSLPNAELNGDTPLQVAQRNGYNGQVLEPIFTRIEYGIDF